ncbi:hypothetical protein IB49_02415 [Geobacillus sp. LC300]|nr:hypothetical protein IB49_02415 [Geobacillus sp. LC300]
MPKAGRAPFVNSLFPYFPRIDRGWPFWRSFRSFFVKRITYAGPAVKSPFEPAQHRQSADGYT